MESQYWIPTVSREGQHLDAYSSMLADGIIFVNAPIDQRIAGLMMSSLLHIHNHSQTVGQPKIYLNTRAGDIVSALSVVDIMERYKRDNVVIQTAAFGETGVAACLILAAGTPGQRKAARNCQVSLHWSLDSLALANVKSNEMKARQSERIKSQFVNLFARYTRQPVDLLRVRINTEEYLDADACLSNGIVDDLI